MGVLPGGPPATPAGEVPTCLSVAPVAAAVFEDVRLIPEGAGVQDLAGPGVTAMGVGLPADLPTGGSTMDLASYPTGGEHAGLPVVVPSPPPRR